jgi:peptidyl-prolyl cis-trans isomerase SurA
MAWQRSVVPALVVLGVTLTGCESSSHTLARNQFIEDPELMAAIARNGGQESVAARAQKPDIRPVSSLLDIPPERPADLTNNQSAVSIRATVNEQAILDEDIRAIAFEDLLRANYLPEPQRSQRVTEVFNRTLERIIEREIVLQDAFTRLRGNDKGGDRFIRKLMEAAHESFDKRFLTPFKTTFHYKTNAEVDHHFAEAGVSLASIRRQWERNFMEFEYLQNRIFPLLDTRVNHKEIVDYYEKHTEEFQVADSVKWQDLFVANAKHASREEARAFAESLAAKASGGADFVKLVKENDDGDSTLRDGDGVGNKRGDIKPAEAEDILFKLKDGQVGTLIELPTGFHVIRLVHRDVAGQLPFDEKVQRQIRDKLRTECFEREKKRIVRALKEQAVIQYARKAN